MEEFLRETRLLKVMAIGIIPFLCCEFPELRVMGGAHRRQLARTSPKCPQFASLDGIGIKLGHSSPLF